MPLLILEATGLDAARSALAASARRPLHAGLVLGCAALMTAGALAMSGLVVMAVCSPVSHPAGAASVRAAISL